MTAGFVSQAGWLARTLARTVGRRALRRVAPVWLVALLAGGIVFHRNGMDPGDLVRAASSSASLRLALLGSWVILVLPAARESHRSPAIAYLLSLPVARWRVGVAVGVVLGALQLPVLLLWAHGGWVVLSAAAASVALTAALAAPVSGVSLMLVSAVIVGVVYAWPAPAGLAGAGVAALAVRRLVESAGDSAAGGSRSPRRRSRFPALVAALLLCTWRRDRAVLVRALLATLAGAVIAWLPIVNNHVSAAGTIMALMLGVGAASATVGAFGVTQRLAALEARESWLLDGLGVTPSFRRTAVAVAGVALFAPLGVLHGGLVAGLLGVEPWSVVRLALASATWFAGLTVLAARSALSEVRADEPSATRVVLALAVMIAAQVGAAYGRELAPVVLLVVAVVAAGPWLVPSEDAGTGAVDSLGGVE